MITRSTPCHYAMLPRRLKAATKSFSHFRKVDDASAMMPPVAAAQKTQQQLVRRWPARASAGRGLRRDDGLSSTQAHTPTITIASIYAYHMRACTGFQSTRMARRRVARSAMQPPSPVDVVRDDAGSTREHIRHGASHAERSACAMLMQPMYLGLMTRSPPSFCFHGNTARRRHAATTTARRSISGIEK